MENNLKCVKCGKEMQEGMKYCPYCGEAAVNVPDNDLADTVTVTPEKRSEEKHIKRSAAGIIGMLGVIVACVGVFMPFFEAWGRKISYYGLLSDSGEQGILAGIIFFAMLEIFLFYFEMNIAGNIFAIVAFVLFLINLFGGDNNGMLIGDIMDYVEVGFWVMCVGLVMMSVSSLFGTIKQ